MTNTPNTDYVIRSVTLAPDGRVTYAIVDMTGRLIHATVTRKVANTDELDVILCAAVARIPERRVG